MDSAFVDGEIEGVVLQPLRFHSERAAGSSNCSAKTCWNRSGGR